MARIALAATLWLLAGAAARADAEVDALIATLARPAPATTPFLEVRFSRLLARPLVVRGKLEYGGPAALAREVDEPFRERTEIRGENVVVTREGQKPRRFSRRRAPELDMLIASFGALLGGDAAALERVFTLDLERNPDGWRLSMTPRAARARQRVARVTLTGRAGEVRCLTLLEPDEDASVLLLGEASRTLTQPPEPASLQEHCGAAGDKDPAAG